MIPSTRVNCSHEYDEVLIRMLFTLRLPHRNDAKIAKICILWTFWLVTQLINHLFKIQKKRPFCKRTMNNFGTGFLHIVTKSIGKMKYTTKFIYPHSSQKETQLSMLRFFWRRVYLFICLSICLSGFVRTCMGNLVVGAIVGAIVCAIVFAGHLSHTCCSEQL